MLCWHIRRWFSGQNGGIGEIQLNGLGLVSLSRSPVCFQAEILNVFLMALHVGNQFQVQGTMFELKSGNLAFVSVVQEFFRACKHSSELARFSLKCLHHFFYTIQRICLRGSVEQFNGEGEFDLSSVHRRLLSVPVCGRMNGL